MRRFFVLLLLALPLPADQLTYQKPPKEILDILNAPALPALAVNPTRTYATLSETVRYPSIAEVSAPMLRLAGIRIDPRTNGLHLAPYNTSITLIKLPEATKMKVALPPGARASALRWSPDGKQFAFTNITAVGPIELWLGDPATGKTHKIENVRINAVLGEPIEWLQDNKTLIVKTVPVNRGPAPREPLVPPGPTVQESDGHAIGVATYEDLLENPHDEDLFEYYATSQLVKVDARTGAATPIGKPGLLDEVSPSPDGSHLLITREHRPFSYLHPYREFPKEVEVWSPGGAVEYKVASLPLPARIPLGGVQTGPRQIRWVANQPATIFWVEALDGGNPKEKVPHRDRIVAIQAPFKGQPVEVFKTEERFAGIQFGKDFALVEDQARISRLLRTFEIDPSKPGSQPKLIWSRNAQDRYKDPGRPVEKVQRAGRGGGGFFGPSGSDSTLLQNGETILLQGDGASPQGDHPFLDRFDLNTLQSERIFQSAPDKYEVVEAVLDDQGKTFITRRESTTEPPNYFLHSGGSEKALTNFTDPAPRIRRITKQLVTYKRADGVPLSMELYLPPDYKPGTRLPAVMWAYPREYNDAATAGEIQGSPNRFTTITGYSELFFLLDGYAVLENAAMPVVGTIDVVNNTYVDQIVADAKAAIDKVVDMGVVDRNRIGVGGHSYGAFMTANLLAHCNLFRAGIAESGAYNRTLTPFGFQSERRSFWEAKQTYENMSPFFFADKIKDPILLIHGAADDNSGTFPIQSDRMYQAIRGNGGTVRLVFLPNEAHGYRGKETIEHVLWEKFQWFDKYVKNAGPQTSRAE
ncbi:MAG TPA: prolyl oligopeptidase family serine peptidase [Bryobacteraceae bacterium]|jgi:dipeptidyl aminopeptidase/acylaminoacyl peptidase|nr:prolyl oligopeptidase family serine peptidase [Bryobacteraceae bacterium]